VREELPDDRDYEGIAAAIVFADHLHWSWAYAGLPIATLDSADDNFHVFIIGGAVEGFQLRRASRDLRSSF
jgi:hypothetical protein